MINLIVIALVLVTIVFFIKNKIVIRFDTLFRKGFKKTDDSFGVYCYVGKQGTRQNV